MKGKAVDSEHYILTKERLLESALSEFNRSGFLETNVEDITDKIGVSRSTFYLYFKNKMDLLVSLLQDTLDKISVLHGNKGCLKEWLNVQDLKKFEQPLLYHMQALEGSSGLFKALVEGMYQDRQVFDLFAKLFHDTTNLFCQKIESLQRKGLHKHSNPTVMSQLMASTIIFPCLMKFSGMITCDFNRLVKTISYMLFSILNFNDKKLKYLNSNGAVIKTYDKTRNALLLAAQKEFDIHGYFDTNISNIAKRAGYNRSTFYRYFKDKDDIIQQMIEELITPLITSGNRPGSIINSENADDLDSLVRGNYDALALFQKSFSTQRAFIQGSFNSEKLRTHYIDILNNVSGIIKIEIDKIKKEKKIKGFDSQIVSQILPIVTSFSYLFYLEGIIKSSEHEFTVNLGIYLYYFFNFIPSRS